LKTKLIN